MRTATGTALFVVVPSPISPNLLSPQQYGRPSIVNPQLVTEKSEKERNRRLPPKSAAVAGKFPCQQTAAPAVVNPHLLPAS
jgi:hypothetical protein